MNPIVWRLTISFLCMTFVISGVACYFAYRQKHMEILAELDKQLLQIGNEYMNVREDFWALYLPVFEYERYSALLKDYFHEPKRELSPIERFELAGILSHMALMNNYVQWIVLYAPDRENNYIYFLRNNSL